MSLHSIFLSGFMFIFDRQLWCEEHVKKRKDSLVVLFFTPLLMNPTRGRLTHGSLISATGPPPPVSVETDSSLRTASTEVGRSQTACVHPALCSRIQCVPPLSRWRHARAHCVLTSTNWLCLMGTEDSAFAKMLSHQSCRYSPLTKCCVLKQLPLCFDWFDILGHTYQGQSLSVRWVENYREDTKLLFSLANRWTDSSMTAHQSKVFFFTF